MKRLTLVRHAKAQPQQLGMDDFDRPLNERGESDAVKMGQRLRHHQSMPDRILSSPARRAMSTALLIAREIGYPADDIVTEMGIYNATVADLQSVIEQLDPGWDSVMLVGHNPGFASLSYFLTNEPRDMPTCAVAGIELAVASWADMTQSSGTMLFFDYPKKPA